MRNWNQLITDCIFTAAAREILVLLMSCIGELMRGPGRFLSGSSIGSTVAVIKRPIRPLYRVDCIVEGLGYPLIATGQYGAILVS